MLRFRRRVEGGNLLDWRQAYGGRNKKGGYRSPEFAVKVSSGALPRLI